MAASTDWYNDGEGSQNRQGSRQLKGKMRIADDVGQQKLFEYKVIGSFQGGDDPAVMRCM